MAANEEKYCTECTNRWWGNVYWCERETAVGTDEILRTQMAAQVEEGPGVAAPGQAGELDQLAQVRCSTTTMGTNVKVPVPEAELGRAQLDPPR